VLRENMHEPFERAKPNDAGVGLVGGVESDACGRSDDWNPEGEREVLWNLEQSGC